jgi:hypothetical protein
MTSNAMRRDERSRRRLEGVQIPLRLKLSALWVATMFLYVYVDILYFYKPGTIDDILVGRVWEFDISQGWALGALALMTIPILMVFLSLVLPTMAARWSNLVVASLLVLVAIANVVGETWAFVWFGSAVEAALLLMISRYAWRWPRLVD